MTGCAIRIRSLSDSAKMAVPDGLPESRAAQKVAWLLEVEASYGPCSHLDPDTRPSRHSLSLSLSLSLSRARARTLAHSRSLSLTLDCSAEASCAAAVEQRQRRQLAGKCC